MKNILCYGDSNTWGHIAGSINLELRLAKRYAYNVRWTGVLQGLLGSDYRIIEGGLNGRNTSFDETHIIRPSRNGLATLPLVMEMNYPLDLVILMLGTNDAQITFKEQASIERIIFGIKGLIQCVKTSKLGPNYSSPKVLLISPPAITPIEANSFQPFDVESITKIEQFGELFKNIAQDEECYFLDSKQIVNIDLVDGLHIDMESQKLLAEALFAKIKKIFKGSNQ